VARHLLSAWKKLNGRRLAGLLGTSALVLAGAVCRGEGAPSATPAASPPEILPFSQVRAGMKGSGLTVFSGTLVERFDAEILGTLENTGPQQNLILARLSGGPLERTGVMEGMSGSPVYVDGKLLGAVAYSWEFEREPIAGITPIEEMLRLDRAKSPFAREGIPQFVRLPEAFRHPRARLSRAALVGYYQAQLGRLLGEAAQARRPSSMPRPLTLPLAIAGLPAGAIARLSGGGAFAPVQGAPSAFADGPPLAPGSAVGVALLQGDLQATAVGTVTSVEGDRILAFGHPLFNLGPVELPMTKARVEALLPSLQSSFKIAGPAGPAGILRQDTASGIAGTVGGTARMVPVTLEISSEGDGSRTYSFQVAEHPLLSPVLLFMTLGGLLESAQVQAADTSVEFLEGSVLKLSEDRRVDLQELFAGEQAVYQASATVAFISQLLMENEFEPARIEGIQLKARSSGQRRVARITSAWTDRVRVHPGETITVSVSLKPFREPETSLEIKVPIPAELEPGPLTLHVGDAVALVRTGAEGAGQPVPRDLDHLVDLINGIRRSERVYVLASREEPSVWMGDQALPNLPPSKGAVLAGTDPRGSSQVRRIRPILEEEVATGFAVEGYRRLEVEVVR